MRLYRFRPEPLNCEQGSLIPAIRPELQQSAETQDDVYAVNGVHSAHVNGVHEDDRDLPTAIAKRAIRSRRSTTESEVLTAAL